jgi:hypothetical protein
MKMSAWAVGVCCLALVAGCGKGIPDPVDPDQAGAVLRTALDAWKQGAAHGDLQNRSPPIYFNEPEWRAGKQLTDFKVGKVSLMGRQGRSSVKLSLRDKAGQVTEREISYLIDTAPQAVITREGLGP